LVPVLPEDEIEKILEYIKDKSASFDRLIQKSETAITLLKERRSALISAAVTGKIDVRDWQPPQPSEEVDA
jgi:type I restriction enzyme S subunit